MHANVCEDRIQCSNSERPVPRNGDVMLAALIRRKAHVASGLAGLLIAESCESLGEFIARDVSWQTSYTAMTSSWT